MILVVQSSGVVVKKICDFRTDSKNINEGHGLWTTMHQSKCGENDFDNGFENDFPT